MDLEIIATLIFFLAIGIYLAKKRKELEFHYGIIIKRWKKGIEKIDKLVKGKKKILRKVGNIFVAIGILISLYGIYFLIRYTLQLKQVFGLALPSVAGVKYPGPVISIPFWYWIIAIFTVIASHETMHAIFSRVEKVKLKNYGIIFFLLFPIGAFVDPEKRAFEKLKGIKKMRIYAAGSFGNFLVFAIVLLLVLLSTKISDSLIESIGLKFEVLPNTPAEKAGLEGIIFKINNQTIKNTQDLIDFLNKTKPGENITILTTKGEFFLSLAQHPEEKNRGFIGINNTREVYAFKTIFTGYVPDSLINFLTVWYSLLFWLAILNLGVAIANLLPAKPLDGGYLFEEIFKNFFGRNGERIANALSAIIFFLLFFNIFAVNLIKAI
jgi:membrane-associated protease RseP (regulator of RpoE activity)